jgi:hypothetical protein
LNFLSQCHRDMHTILYNITPPPQPRIGALFASSVRLLQDYVVSCYCSLRYAYDYFLNYWYPVPFHPPTDAFFFPQFETSSSNRPSPRCSRASPCANISGLQIDAAGCGVDNITKHRQDRLEENRDANSHALAQVITQTSIRSFRSGLRHWRLNFLLWITRRAEYETSNTPNFNPVFEVIKLHLHLSYAGR